MTAALRLGQPAGRIALRIAALLSDPARFMRPAAVRHLLSDVGGRDLGGLADAPLARRALPGFLRAAAGLDRIVQDEGLPDAAGLATDIEAALDLALGDLDDAARVRPFLVAAVCQREIQSAMLRTDREALAALLGPDAVAFASREARAFYPALASLAPQAGTVLRSAAGTPFDAHPAAAFADRVLLAHVAAHSRLAGRLMAARLHGGEPPARAPELDTAHHAELRRLLARGRAA